MIQVELIRGRTLRLLQQLSIFISCLPEREQTALEKMSGIEGQRTFARITEYVLVQLGNEPSTNQEQYQPSYRTAQKFVTDAIKEPEPDRIEQLRLKRERQSQAATKRWAERKQKAAQAANIP